MAKSLAGEKLAHGELVPLGTAGRGAVAASGVAREGARPGAPVSTRVDERALSLWQALFDGKAAVGMPANASIAERTVAALRDLALGVSDTIAAVLDEIGDGLPKPIANLNVALQRSATAEQAGSRLGGFNISGKPLPYGEGKPFVYIQCEAGFQTTLRVPCPAGTQALAVALVGNVHYRSGIPARLTFTDSTGKAAFEAGLGSEWLVTMPAAATLRFEPGPNRCIIVIATVAGYSIYCDGVRIAAGAFSGIEGWQGLSLSVAPRLAPFADLLLHHAVVWGLSEADAARLEAKLSDPTAALPAALLEAGDALGLARVCRNVAGVHLAPLPDQFDVIERAALALTDEHKSHLALMIAKCLPPEQAAPLQRQMSKALGSTVIDARNVVVELARNPVAQRRLHNLFKPKNSADMFHAVDGIDFKLYNGDVLGIIGHNGAGKSTLLRALCGLIDLKAGSIEIADRFLLLRPGVGMRDELTGRENIASMAFYLGLGMRDVAALSDDIIAFSELGDHIDKPVRFYSDGMRARLGFSIATSFAPEVLFLDELLGAGDISFQERAQERLRKFIAKAGTVVVVTHSIDFVLTSCTKALLMHNGKQVCFGDPEEAISRYLFLMER